MPEGAQRCSSTGGAGTRWKHWKRWQRRERLQPQQDARGGAAGGASDAGGVESDLAAVGVPGDACQLMVGLEIDDHPAGILLEREVDDAFDDGVAGVEEGEGRFAAEAA